MDKFDIKKFLIENKITKISQLEERLGLNESIIDESIKDITPDDIFFFLDRYRVWDKLIWLINNVLLSKVIVWGSGGHEGLIFMGHLVLALGALMSYQLFGSTDYPTFGFSSMHDDYLNLTPSEFKKKYGRDRPATHPDRIHNRKVWRKDRDHERYLIKKSGGAYGIDMGDDDERWWLDEGTLELIEEGIVSDITKVFKSLAKYIKAIKRGDEKEIKRTIKSIESKLPSKYRTIISKSADRYGEELGKSVVSKNKNKTLDIIKSFTKDIAKVIT